jgi:hypothetical protein
LKDKHDVEVQIGDYLVDHIGDLSKVVDFDTGDPRDLSFKVIPIVNLSHTMLHGGYWYLRPREVVKVDEDEALIFALKGSL